MMLANRTYQFYVAAGRGFRPWYRQLFIWRRPVWMPLPIDSPAGVVAGWVFLLAAVGLVQPVAAVAPVRTMSFNIRFDHGVPNRNANAWVSTAGTSRRDLALNVIHDYAPDVLGVQEALTNQVNDLQVGLPEFDFYGVGRDNGIMSGEYSGIFYRSDRFLKTNQGTFWLSRTPDRPSFFGGTCCRRIASWVILTDQQAESQEYFVLNTHWDHQVQDARELSAQLIRERIKSLAENRPLIVMGDMNATESNNAYRDLIGSNDPTGFQLLDSFREVVPVPGLQERTFNGFTGASFGSRIDYILHSNFFKAEQASIVRTEFSGQYPSDHYPVTALLRPIPEPKSILLLVAGALPLLASRPSQSFLT